MSYIRDYLRNLAAGGLPLPQRIARAAGNLGRRIARREACCGRPGEPGC